MFSVIEKDFSNHRTSVLCRSWQTLSQTAKKMPFKLPCVSFKNRAGKTTFMSRGKTNPIVMHIEMNINTVYVDPIHQLTIHLLVKLMNVTYCCQACGTYTRKQP